MDDNIFYNSRNMLIIPMVNKAFTMVDYAFLWWFFYRFTIVNNDRYFMDSSDRLEMLKYIIFFSDRWQFHSTNGQMDIISYLIMLFSFREKTLIRLLRKLHPRVKTWEWYNESLLNDNECTAYDMRWSLEAGRQYIHQVKHWNMHGKVTMH